MSHVPPSFWMDLGNTPHTVRHVMADGVRTRVLEAGSGSSPVLLLHGTGGHLEAFARIIGPLALKKRVIAYDLPSHGWSDGPVGRSYEVAGYVGHLKALLEELGIARASYVGQSLGGWVAARLAIDEPERVLRLALIGTGGATAIPSVMALIRDSSRSAVATPSEGAVRQRLEWLFHDRSAVPEELVLVRKAIYAQLGAARRMEQALTLQDPTIRARNLIPPQEWRRISAPTLVIWGEDDQTAPPEVGEQVAAWIPDALFLPVPASGHWPQFERPEIVSASVLDFFKE